MLVDPSVVVSKAASQIGVHEEPWGSNSGPQVRAYQAATFLGGTGWPWCMAYVAWVYRQVGVAWAYNGAGAYDVFGHYARFGWLASGPAPGYFACVNEGSGHGCLVEHVESVSTRAGRTTYVHTIDGNVRNQVMRCVRPLGYFRGFIHSPSLVSKPLPQHPPVAPEPWWEIVTSASGHTVVVFRGPRGKAQRLLPEILKKYHVVTVKRGKR